MTEVLSVLSGEHANIARLLKALERQIDVFNKAGTPDYDIIQGVIDYFLSYPDLYHHPKENLVFAKLRERDPAAAGKVGDLQAEHEELAARTRELAAGVRAVLDDAQVPRSALNQWARNFIDLQRQHMKKEEEIFFPAAVKALSAEDWRDLEARMTDDDDPLFGDCVGERYETLNRELLRGKKVKEHHR